MRDTLVESVGKEKSNSHDYDTWGHVENSWSGPEHPEAYSQRSRIDYIMFTEGEVEETKLDVKAEMETRFCQNGSQIFPQNVVEQKDHTRAETICQLV